ncbi:MAG: glycosyltransferase family 2 protein [Minisyncoccota bacterium]
MMPDTKNGKALFTIVTPSFNQGQYIEQTIRSVLSQEGDFSIQYIIADGGSTDNSVTVIKKYDDLLKNNQYPIKCNGITLHYWSRKDRGQAAALNQGFAMADGAILGWINSDDFYEAGAFQKVAAAFAKEPTADMVYGNGYTIFDSTRTKTPVIVPEVDYRRLLYHGCEIFQPSAFFTKESFARAGGIDDTLHYSFDYALWLDLLKHGKASRIDEYLADFRLWPQSKTASSFARFIEEEKRVLKRHTIGFWGPYHFYMLKRAVKKIIFYEPLKKLVPSSRHISR